MKFLARLACATILALFLLPPQHIAGQAQQIAIALDPPSGPRDTVVTIHGRGAEPNSTVSIVFGFFGDLADCLANDRGQAAVPIVVRADDRGVFAASHRPFSGAYANLSPNVRSVRYLAAGPGREASPWTCFAVGERLSRAFPETGKSVEGRFLAHWEEHGGLAVNGYPLSEPFTEVLEDGRPYRVQYFERVRLEYHPENPAPNDVLLGQFGRRLHPADPPVAPIAGARFFPETGHNIPPDLADYWDANGGLAQFGFPLSEVIRERLENGREYEVQYFERARLERHPENPAPNQILLGQFGRGLLPAYPPVTPAADAPGWLDRTPVPQWNRVGAALPVAPPITNPRDSFCPPLKQGGTPAMRAVIAAGWQIADDAMTLGNVTVVEGASGADGMCRPVQYQAFVFVGGRYAGTLSPRLMNARTDEALATVMISPDGGTLTATYVRYNGSEPLCCPSRISTATFTIYPDGPLVTLGGVTTDPPVQR